MKPGDAITLYPTQGVYQTPKTAIVVRVTETQIIVTRIDKQGQIKFHKKDGSAMGIHRTEFPCYRIKYERVPKPR